MNPNPLDAAALEKAKAAFKEIETAWLRRGPVHGPDWPDASLEAAILAYLAALPVQEVTEAQVEAALDAYMHPPEFKWRASFSRDTYFNSMRAVLIAARGVK